MGSSSRRKSFLLPLLTVFLGLAACAAPSRGPVVRSARPDSGQVRTSEVTPSRLPRDPGLDDLLRFALDGNPRILAAHARAEAAAESATIEGWLPNPEVLVGWYETPVETRVGPQEWSLGIRQRVPFPTKLGTKADLADVGARRARLAFERVVRDELSEVVEVAFELAYLREALEITDGIEVLLGRYTAAAAGADAGLLSDLFRAETQRAQLLSDRVALEDLLRLERERLASLLGLPGIPELSTIRLPAVPGTSVEYEELQAAAEAHSQELAEAGLAVESAALRTTLARQSRLPDFSFGVTRIFTDRLDASLGMDPDGNGRDPVIFQAGVSIPLWLHRDEAAIRQARALERAAAQDRRAAAVGLRQRVAKGWVRLRNAERLDRLYREVLLPRAAAAARGAEDLLAGTSGSDAGALETVAVLKNFRLAAARARADHGQAVAALEAIIGRPFAGVAP